MSVNSKTNNDKYKVTWKWRLLSLLDPLNTVQPSVFKRVSLESARMFEIAATVNFIFWPIMWLSCTVLNDRLKPNFNSWVKYRIVLASLMFLAYFIFLIFKTRIRVLAHLAVFSLATIITYGYSWSHVFGQPLPREFITLFPFLIFATCYRSLIIAVVFQFFSLVLSYTQWSEFNHIAWVFTDFEIAAFALVFVHIVHRSLIENKANRYFLGDLEKSRIETEQRFYNEVLKFISPSLVKTLRRRAKGYEDLIAAIDNLLLRKRIWTSVLYCDWRDFTSRADSIEFLEQELIPSTSAIMDICAKNQGVSRPVGDAVLTFFPIDDPEEALLMSIRSAFESLVDQFNRSKNWNNSKRFFIVTFGQAIVGNMASQSQRELTIMGKPANLAARMDELTKVPKIKELIISNHGILLDSSAYSRLITFSEKFEVIEVGLHHMNVSIRSFPDEANIYILGLTHLNLSLLNELLTINGHSSLDKINGDFFEKTTKF